MHGKKGTKLSKWKTIIISNNQTGEKIRYELDEKERLINKIKPSRKKNIPQQYIKIRFTKNFFQKHKKLDMILDHMVASYNKNENKKLPFVQHNNKEEQQITNEKSSEQGDGNLYKDLMNRFFSNPEDCDTEMDNEFILSDEINFL